VYLTPIGESRGLAEKAGVSRLFLKREDQTKTGSFKYRSAARQVEDLVEHGENMGVVSSSGNAAISLAHEAAAQGVRLFAFVSPDISPAKLTVLASYGPIIVRSRRAMRMANYLAARYRIRNLRPSVDDRAVLGFVSLGEEIEEQMVDLGGAQTIVSFCTSGASILGISRGYRAEPRPTFMAVQNHTAGRYGTLKSPRMPDVQKVAELFSVSDEACSCAQKVLNEFGLRVAPEAVASFAAICERRPSGNVVWVVSGKDWDADAPTITTNPHIFDAETLEDVDRIYARHTVVS
jgi:cysteine synthase